MTVLVRSVMCAGLISCPLLAGDLASAGDSGAGNFWELILGLMVTIFGGMAFCYGLVKLGEIVMQRLRVKNAVPASVPPLRRAA
jgi:hypothetical protein